MATVSQTITPTSGYSPASMQMKSLLDTLGSMGPLPQGAQQVANTASTAGNNVQQMAANYPQVKQSWADQAGQAGQFGNINQAGQQMSDAYKLFLHDMELGQKYGATQQPTPTDAPKVPGIVDTAPMLTLESNRAGYQGIQNPYTADRFYGGSIDAVTKSLSSLLGSSGQFNLDAAKNLFGQSRDIYEMQMKGEQAKQDDALKALQFLVDQSRQQQDFDVKKQEVALKLRQQGIDIGRLDLDKQKALLDQVKTLSDAGYNTDDIVKQITGKDVSTTQGDVNNNLLNANSLIESAISADPTMLSNTIKNMDAKTRKMAERELAKQGLTYADLQKIQKSYVIDQFLSVGKQWAALNPLQKLNPFDPTSQSVRAQMSAITQIFGKELEGGKLSDNDFKRYAALMGNNWNIPSSVEQANVKALNEFFRTRLGVDEQTIAKRLKAEEIRNNLFSSQYGNQDTTQSGKTVMTAPDGKQYYVDPGEVEEAKKNGWK